MSEFLHGAGLLCATIVGAAGIAFGLFAGVKAAAWMFGPLRINSTTEKK